MNRLIIGTCCIPRIELYEINFPKIMDLILQINHIEIYWLINIDHPLWIKNITDATKADIINFIDNITNGAKINVVYFHEHKTIGFRDGIERIVKYIDANNLFTNETDYLYLEDDMSPSKNLNLKDILTLDPYKKLFIWDIPTVIWDGLVPIFMVNIYSKWFLKSIKIFKIMKLKMLNMCSPTLF